MNKILITVLSSTLLLAACGRTTSTPPVTAHKAGALYQVDVSISNDHAATASIHPANTPRIGAQDLTNAPEPVDIDFRSLTTSTFVAKQDGVDTRHIHTTMKVTNNTGQTIRNLTFLPVVRSDADSDPSNNTQTPTVAGTPFLNVRLYDGSDANAQATSMKLTQAKEVSLKTGEVSLNTDASPYLTGLDVGQLTAAVPSDMKATVMNSGWVTGNTLAPGASTYVTFAVDMPVDRANPKTQPFSFSLLVTSAQDVTGAGIGASVDPAQVQGVLKNWTFGAGENLRSISTSSASPALVSSIGADGTVDGTLPTNPTTYPFIDGDCTFQTTGSAPNFGYNTASLRAYSADGDLLGRVREYTPDGKAIYRIFSDTAIRLQGTYKCTYDDLPTLVDFDLKRGWNITTETSTATNYEWKTASPDTRSVLTFVPATESVDVTFPDQSALNLRAGQSVQRDIKLAQTGGISGDVTLETDVPGVTVSPSIVTLPSFSAQGNKGVSTTGVIKAQSLSPKLTFTVAQDVSPYYGPLHLIVKKNGVEVGRGTLYDTNLVIPTVSAGTTGKFYAFGGYTNIVQNTTETVNAYVSSVNGFSGKTTITLDNLPDGMTASTETVDVPESGSVNVNITLNISASVKLGSYRLKFAGQNYAPGGYSEIPVTVLPARTALDLKSISGASPARGGIWVLGTDNNGQRRLVRTLGNAVVQNEAAPTGMFLSTRSGNAAFLETGYRFNPSGYASEYFSLVTIVRTDGTRIVREFKDNLNYPLVDANDNLWFIEGYDSSVNLKMINMATGSISTVSTGHGAIAAMSTDGLSLMLFDSSSTPQKITRISTTSQTLLSSASLSQPIYAYPADMDNDGMSYSAGGTSLTRIAPDGQVTTSTLPSGSGYVNSTYGIDRANPNLLWVNLGYNVGFIDLSKATLVTKDVQQVNYGAVDLSGGLNELVTESGSWYDGPFYASRLTP